MKLFASEEDPFNLNERVFSLVGNNSVSGKSQVYPRINPYEKTGVFIVAGQSNAANTGEIAYTPVNASKVDNVDILTGGTYAAADPLLGCSNSVSGTIGNLFTRVADKLITAGKYQRVILIPVALGGSSVSQWDTILYPRLNIASKRALAQNSPITAVLWQHGEADNTLATTQASYTGSFNSMRTKLEAPLLAAPWFLAKSTYTVATTSASVRAAVTALVNGSTLRLGPDTDTLTGTTVNRQADDTHFKAAGAEAAAILWRDVLVSALP